MQRCGDSIAHPLSASCQKLDRFESNGCLFLCAGHVQTVRCLQRQICRWSVSVLILLIQCLVNNPSTLYCSCPWHTLTGRWHTCCFLVNVPAFSRRSWKSGRGNLQDRPANVCFAGPWPCFTQFASDHLRANYPIDAETSPQRGISSLVDISLYIYFFTYSYNHAYIYIIKYIYIYEYNHLYIIIYISFIYI